jgi:hypothetical protein
MKRAFTLRAASRIGAIALLLQIGMLGGCGDSPPPPEVEPEPESLPEEPVAEATPDVLEPTPDEIPIPEDFEEEAAKDISVSDLRAQLDALEQEISSDSL